MGKTIAIASGKGGTGKTMFTANLGAILAEKGYKVAMIDMDAGTRNLDLYLGLENNVVYDVMDVLRGVCRIKQALIRHKKFQGIRLMPAAPKKSDDDITPLHMKVLSNKLRKTFDYVLIDCPAGIGDGLELCLGGADEVIVVLTPEIASFRDGAQVQEAIKKYNTPDYHYVLNRVNAKLMKAGLAPNLDQIPENITHRLLGIIQEDENIHISTNLGTPIVSMGDNYIYKNFVRIADRIIAQENE